MSDFDSEDDDFQQQPVKMFSLNSEQPLKPTFKPTKSLGLISSKGIENSKRKVKIKLSDKKSVPSFSTSMKDSFKTIKSFKDLKLVPEERTGTNVQNAESTEDTTGPTVEVLY